MTPHQALLDLANYDGLPNDGVDAALADRDAMVPLLLERIEHYLALPPEDRDDDPALFPIAFLMAGWREKRAYRPLARLFRLGEDDLEALLGDAVTEHAHKIIAAVCDGDPQPIYDIILDPAASQWSRDRMFDALVMLVIGATLDKAAVVAFVRQAHDALLADENMVWHGWQAAVALLGLADLAPQVRAAIDDVRVPEGLLEFKHFRGDLRHALSHPAAPSRDAQGLAPFGTALEELATYSPQRDDVVPDAFDSAWDIQQPVVNEFRHVGRNDPCPCGSGLKHKKCCLPKRAA